jgi:DNA invertase Pin-like site-specific DNA recombinase
MNQHNNNLETDLLGQIVAGKYRDKYLVYNRKSTDEPNNQKNSITYQKTENTRFAHRELLPIAAITLRGFCTDGVISERHSGFSEDTNIVITDDGIVHYRIERPKFQRMLQFVSQSHFKGVISLCWDRISRNKGDATLVRKLMRNGADFRFAYAKYDQTSTGALHMDIDGMFAEHHSRVTSEKVRIATRAAVELCDRVLSVHPHITLITRRASKRRIMTLFKSQQKNIARIFLRDIDDPRSSAEELRRTPYSIT